MSSSARPSLWHHRDCRLLWGGQGLSTLGLGAAGIGRVFSIGGRVQRRCSFGQIICGVCRAMAPLFPLFALPPRCHLLGARFAACPLVMAFLATQRNPQLRHAQSPASR